MDAKKLMLARMLEKKAFQPMGQQPPPQGGGMPPPGAPPAGMPPQGGQPPAPGGAPQGGGDPMIQQMIQILQDPQIQQALQQQGITMGPQGPMQNGQIVPPQQMMQILQQMGAMPPQGGAAPGGQPPPMPPEMGGAMAPESMGSADGQASGEPSPDAGAEGQPPPPDAGAGAPPMEGGQPLTMEAFMQIMPQMLEAYQKDNAGKGGGNTADFEARIDQLEQMVTALVQRAGMSPAAAGLGATATGMPEEGMPPEVAGGVPPEMAGMPPPPQNPGAVDAIQAAAAVPPGPQGGMPVMASEKYVPEVRKVSGPSRIQGIISKMKHAR